MTMDTSIFAYLTPAKPIKRGGYAVTTYLKGRPEEGFFDSWQHMGNDYYRCVKYYDKKPETLTLPLGEYHNTTLSEDDTTPYAKVRKARYFNRYLTDAEVDEQVADLSKYGLYATKDGERIDPLDIYLEPPK